MHDDKKTEQKPEPEIKVDKKPIKPGDIIGKIDIHDTRERRDGPEGNQNENHFPAFCSFQSLKYYRYKEHSPLK